MADGKWSPSTCNKSRASGSGCARQCAQDRAGQPASRQQGRARDRGASVSLASPPGGAASEPARSSASAVHVRCGCPPSQPLSRNIYPSYPSLRIRKPACPARLSWPNCIANASEHRRLTIASRKNSRRRHLAALAALGIEDFCALSRREQGWILTQSGIFLPSQAGRLKTSELCLVRPRPNPDLGARVPESERS